MGEDSDVTIDLGRIRNSYQVYLLFSYLVSFHVFKTVGERDIHRFSHHCIRVRFHKVSSSSFGVWGRWFLKKTYS